MSPRSALILSGVAFFALFTLRHFALFTLEHVDLRFGFDLGRRQYNGRERMIGFKQVRDTIDHRQVGDLERVEELEMLDIHLNGRRNGVREGRDHDRSLEDLDDASGILDANRRTEVVDTNLETRQVSLKGPDGKVFTITAPEQAGEIDDIEPGDILVVKYLEALESELREPTEEEKAEPWVEVEQSGLIEDGVHPDSLAGARVIRAVVTIEGMNRALGTVTIKDSRGMLHIIADVEAEKMEGVTLGTILVLTYSEALAVTLEKKVAVAQ